MQSAPRLEASRQTIYTNIPEETRFIQVCTIYMMLLAPSAFYHPYIPYSPKNLVTYWYEYPETHTMFELSNGRKTRIRKALFQAVVQIYEVRLGD